MKTIAVLGAGTWGIALARILSNAGHAVTVWSALPKEIEALSTHRTHPNLPGMTLPDTMTFTAQMEEALSAAEVALFAVPSVFVRSVAAQAAPFLREGMLVVDVAKGIEPDTLLPMTGVIGDELRRLRPELSLPLIALSGPTHAEEVAQDMPTSIVSACQDLAAARAVQGLFRSTCLRVYTNPDVLGVELCGALKNVIALASGMAQGLGYGDNARAALITRGIVEITRLGLAMGCREQTFHGLAGVGDLIVTASSRHSRNNRAGQLMGQGVTPAEAVKQVGMVVEGVNALPAAMTLSERYGVDMPIVRAVNAVVNGGVEAARMAAALMQRKQKPETPDMAEPPVEDDVKRLLLPVSFSTVDEEAIALLRRAHAAGDVILVALPPEGRHLQPLLEAIRYVDVVVSLPVDGDVRALAARLGATLFVG